MVNMVLSGVEVSSDIMCCRMTEDKPQRKTSARNPSRGQPSAGAAAAADGKTGETGEAEVKATRDLFVVSRAEETKVMATRGSCLWLAGQKEHGQQRSRP